MLQKVSMGEYQDGAVVSFYWYSTLYRYLLIFYWCFCYTSCILILPSPRSIQIPTILGSCTRHGWYFSCSGYSPLVLTGTHGSSGGSQNRTHPGTMMSKAETSDTKMLAFHNIFQSSLFRIYVFHYLPILEANEE